MVENGIKNKDAETEKKTDYLNVPIEQAIELSRTFNIPLHPHIFLLDTNFQRRIFWINQMDKKFKN